MFSLSPSDKEAAKGSHRTPGSPECDPKMCGFHTLETWGEAGGRHSLIKLLWFWLREEQTLLKGHTAEPIQGKGKHGVIPHPGDCPRPDKQGPFQLSRALPFLCNPPHPSTRHLGMWPWKGACLGMLRAQPRQLWVGTCGGYPRVMDSRENSASPPVCSLESPFTPLTKGEAEA